MFKLLLHSDLVSSFVLSVGMEFFFVTEHLAQGYWTNKRIISRECTNYTGGVRENVPPGNFLKIGLSEMPYPAFLGSNVINSYVYLAELFSESRYSWFPRRSTKIHDSQVFKTKIHDCYMLCNYGSWFMIPLPPPKLKALIAWRLFARELTIVTKTDPGRKVRSLHKPMKIAA